MRDEDLIVYISSLVVFLSILISYRKNIKYGIINTAIFIIYSVVLYYYLFFMSSGGSSLLWLFYIIIFNIVHFIILLIYLIKSLFRN